MFDTEIRNVTTEAAEIAGLEAMLQENQGLCKYLAKLPAERREFLLRKLIGGRGQSETKILAFPAIFQR